MKKTALSLLVFFSPISYSSEYYIIKSAITYNNVGSGVHIDPEAIQESPDMLTLHHFAYTLFCEARGDGKKGMLMVSDVIMNRVNSTLFPNTIYEVIHQKNSKEAKFGQFSCWTGRHALETDKNHRDFNWNPKEREMYKLAFDIALDKMLKTKKYPRLTIALWYHTKAINPYWASKYEYIGSIGSHKLYTNKSL